MIPINTELDASYFKNVADNMYDVSDQISFSRGAIIFHTKVIKSCAKIFTIS